MDPLQYGPKASQSYFYLNFNFKIALIKAMLCIQVHLGIWKIVLALIKSDSSWIFDSDSIVEVSISIFIYLFVCITVYIWKPFGHTSSNNLISNQYLMPFYLLKPHKKLDNGRMVRPSMWSRNVFMFRSFFFLFFFFSMFFDKHFSRYWLVWALNVKKIK